MFLDNFLSFIVYLRFISLKFAATSLFQFVCYSTLFRLLCSKSHIVCKYFRFVCFLSCISSFHSCHLYSLENCNLVLFLATVIVILFYSDKSELEPWTIRYNSKAKTNRGIWGNEVINGWNSQRNCRPLRQSPVPISQGNSRIVHITGRKSE